MGVPVILKNSKNVMSLVLDPDLEYVSLVQEIIKKFREGEKFFGNEPIALRFEGRKLEEREKLQIMDAIHEFTNVKIAVIMDEDRIAEYAANELLRKKLYPEEYEEERLYPECVLVEGDVSPGERIISEKTILVQGDVLRGGIVISNQNIVILGGLMGQAIAGVSGNSDAFIFAGAFCPENFRINDTIGALPRKNDKLRLHYDRLKKKATPTIARLVEDEVILSPLNK